MAKKKNALFAAVAENQNDKTVDTSLSANVVPPIPSVDEANEYVAAYVGKTSTEELIEKLKSEISRLNTENAELTEKLAAYVESKDSNTDICCISAELEKLRYEKNELQNENDTYLMKISELSFENAKLTAQLQQSQALSKDNPNVLKPVQCNNSNQNVVMSKSNFVPYNSRKIDGYSSWN